MAQFRDRQHRRGPPFAHILKELQGRQPPGGCGFAFSVQWSPWSSSKIPIFFYRAGCGGREIAGRRLSPCRYFSGSNCLKPMLPFGQA